MDCPVVVECEYLAIPGDRERAINEENLPGARSSAPRFAPSEAETPRRAMAWDAGERIGVRGRETPAQRDPCTARRVQEGHVALPPLG
ncbi:hypothetical protein Fuma_01116 [Fuerstiella marisgermanici]|uniref:Uncharacterized protein n=1 Tax=Fuerstiella marisgermanici TaxID=1891926 RepID=A0A1P8WBT1_9PLAN|nr:hypothetical protein Fuma_01116 [Fuerstiella marisgermanici]